MSTIEHISIDVHIDGNPNQAEAAISNIAKLWAGLKLLMENPDPKQRGVVQALLSGRPIRHEQYATFLQLSRDIGYDLSHLIRERPMTPEEQVEYERTKVEAQARRDSYVSPFQQKLNEMMAEYVKEKELSEDLLVGETKEFRFTYYESERNYRSDQNTARLPVALIEHFEQDADEADVLPGYLVDQIQQNGDSDFFEDLETYDSELVDSNIEFESID